MPTLPFALVDVFADTPQSGNPLAVVVDDCERLATTAMRDVAREFNQSETTFVLPARDPRAVRRLRSFTASGDEVTGAGHNALGAWWWLAQTGAVPAGVMTQELGDAVLDLTIARQHERLVVAMTQGTPATGAEIAPHLLGGALGLDAEHLNPGPARVVSTGAAHLLVRANDRGAVDAACPDTRALLGVLTEAGAQGAYLYATGPEGVAYARFFNPTVGLWEDAATGSAAGPLAWWLAAGQDTRLTVEQGHAMGRPSRIDVAVEDGVVTLLGSAELSAEGRLHTPDHEEPSA